jgi:hypothetical protein
MQPDSFSQARETVVPPAVVLRLQKTSVFQTTRAYFERPFTACFVIRRQSAWQLINCTSDPGKYPLDIRPR